MLFSLIMLVPIIIALIYDEDTVSAFGSTFIITLATGMVCWFVNRSESDFRSREGFLITVLFYFGLGLFGALPFYLAPALSGSFTDAAFESFSGLTTTGATVIVGLDELPKSILFYRQLLQWLGGMGIIVLAVAILPMLGVGGMQLYRAESPGPVKDAKLTPRIKETAKALWFIYLSLTAACATSYWLAGMSLFDAICHSFSTIAIGGFSTHDESFGYFGNHAIETVAIVFMIVSGINFSLHFFAWRDPRRYLANLEVRTYLASLVVISALVVWSLVQAGNSTGSSLRNGVFQAVSISTTTGFTTTDFSLWPSFTPILLIFAAFVGGCAGSTAGGIKMMRVLLIARQGLREIRRLIHPNGVFPVKLGSEIIPNKIVDAVWGFFAAYISIFLILVVILLGVSDLDFISAYSAVSACLNNLGPGLGSVALNYADLMDSTKWILVLAMLLGRLEIFTLLVVLTPAYWRS